MKPLFTSLTSWDPSSNSTSQSTGKKSWNATGSLERMLQGRMLPAALENFSQTFPLPSVTSFPPFEEPIASTLSDIAPTRTLFEELIGEPRELLLDYVEHPEDYSYGLLPILLSLMNKTKEVKDLSPEEKDLLNQATTICAGRSETLKPSVNEPLSPSVPTESHDDEDDEESEIPWTPSAASGDGEEIALENFHLPDVQEGWWQKSF